MSVASQDCGSLEASPSKKGKASKLKQRGRKDALTKIKDLSASQQIKAAKFDLDGDGVLDEAELAMMKYDVDGDGDLTTEEIHKIIQDLLHDRGTISSMRKIIAGLTVFVFILSLSNLGTSIASALLVKETTADTATGEMKIAGTPDVMGTQNSAETFDALEMDADTRRARRAMVVESLMNNPHGEHAHRRLAKKNGKGGGVNFDVNYMKQSDVEKIKSKCETGRSLNVKRTFADGSKDTKSLCNTGTTVVVKGKKMDVYSAKGPRGKKNKGNTKRSGFDMMMNSNGVDTNFDCDGVNCYMSGSNLRSGQGGPCNLSHGSDDCQDGLVCIPNPNDVAGGFCSDYWGDATWYVDWENEQCLQNCEGGPNCGGYAGTWDEQFVSYKLCCDTHLGYLTGGYSKCLPDWGYFDCTNTKQCPGSDVCRPSPINGSDRWFCT